MRLNFQQQNKKKHKRKKGKKEIIHQSHIERQNRYLFGVMKLCQVQVFVKISQRKINAVNLSSFLGPNFH